MTACDADTPCDPHFTCLGGKCIHDNCIHEGKECDDHGKCTDLHCECNFNHGG